MEDLTRDQEDKTKKAEEDYSTPSFKEFTVEASTDAPYEAKIIDEQDSAESRIKLKRKLKRRQILLKVKQAYLAITLLFSLAVIGYVVNEIGILRLAGTGKDLGAVEAKQSQDETIYECFATAGDTGLSLSLPAKSGSVIAVGFHQAERKEAHAFNPMGDCFNKETTSTVRGAVLESERPVLFVMDSRGRGTAATTAADIAMVPNANVYSPVDGVVTKVKIYDLYSKVTDYHIEIQPDGFPDLRVVLIHMDNIQIVEGQRVQRRETHIGRMRALPQINSQILRYLPERADHVHMQVNPVVDDTGIES